MNRARHIFLPLMALALALPACQSEADKKEPPPMVRTIAVDEPGLHYMWMTPDYGRKRAFQLRQVPEDYHASVMVHHVDWPELPKEVHMAYIANFEGAKSGEARQARLTPKTHAIAMMHAVDWAKLYGKTTSVFAHEVAAFTPGSDRMKASQETLEFFDVEVKEKLYEPKPMPWVTEDELLPLPRPAVERGSEDDR